MGLELDLRSELGPGLGLDRNYLDLSPGIGPVTEGLLEIEEHYSLECFFLLKNNLRLSTVVT